MMLIILPCHSTHILDLNLEKLRDLDNAICEGYDTWVDGAPPEYTDDKFFRERVPIIITTTYGQNQRLGCESPAEIKEELVSWKNDRDFEKIRFMTVALATHYR